MFSSERTTWDMRPRGLAAHNGHIDRAQWLFADDGFDEYGNYAATASSFERSSRR